MAKATMNSDKAKSLIKRKKGEKSRITGFQDPQIAGKLLSMGILPGNEICLVRQAPFGGVWYVQADNLLIALRKKEVACILTT